MFGHSNTFENFCYKSEQKNEVVAEKVLERKANVGNYSVFMSMKIMHQRRGNIHGVRLRGDKFWSAIFEQTSGEGELA